MHRDPKQILGHILPPLTLSICAQVPVVADAFMCYGPLVPDGYGCCYNPRDTQINFGTSACNSSPATVAADFRTALENSLNDMFNLLHSGSGSG